MSTLVIPDLHERSYMFEKLDPLIEKAMSVVFLGDWFDTFSANKQPEFMCEQILKYMDWPKVTFLLGNHDCHYAFKHDGFKCSGYNPLNQFTVDEMISPAVWREFHIYTKVGPWLISHAGFHPNTLQYATPEAEADAIETALDGGFDPIFSAGYARGGRVPIGGPTWLDWNDEFQHIHDMPQIVGHTQGTTVRTTSIGSGVERSYCIDTSNRHVLWIEDDYSVRLELTRGI